MSAASTRAARPARTCREHKRDGARCQILTRYRVQGDPVCHQHGGKQ